MIYSEDIESDMMSIEDWESIEEDAMDEVMRALEPMDYEDEYYSETDIDETDFGNDEDPYYE